MRTFVGVLGLIVGLPGLVAAVHMATLAVASWFYRAPGRSNRAISFLVLVPARNEEKLIAATLDHLVGSIRSDDRILVVADRCTDMTVQIAKAKGVEVLEYDGRAGTGKSAAINVAIEHSRERPWDAVVIIDADSIVDPAFFDAIETAMAPDIAGCQPRSEHEPGTNILSRLSEAAFALQGVTIPRGRQRLNLSARLRGSGMTVSRDTALSRPFINQGVSEDLFYSMGLILDGLRTSHADGARLRSASAPTVRSGAGQRVRWETGRMVGARAFALRLLRTRTASGVEAALYLLSPPIGVAVILLLVGLASASISGWAVAMWTMAAGLAGLVLVVVTGLVQTRARLGTWMALLAAPWYVLWKALIQVRALRHLSRAGESWEPTDR